MAINEMIERSARALAKRHYEHRFGVSDQNHIQMNVDGNWQIFADDARAVIEAIREPTSAMIEAEPDDEPDGNGGFWNKGNSAAHARAFWQAMVDTALADPLPVYDRLTDDALGSKPVEE